MNEEVDIVTALGQIPAALYLLLDYVILRDNTPVLGARYMSQNLHEEASKIDNVSSIWVFLLLASEAIKTYRANPHLE